MLKNVGERQTSIGRRRYEIFSGERGFPSGAPPREAREKRGLGSGGEGHGRERQVEIGIVHSTKNAVHGLMVIEFVAFCDKVSD
jgi:hypothetical protein